jgi:hypothetical protein
MAKTASLNATNRPVSRCAEGESDPALPPGARAIASQRTHRITEDTPCRAAVRRASLHRSARSLAATRSRADRSLT